MQYSLPWHYGAEVTGVDKVGKLDMLRSLGADHVIDCAKISGAVRRMMSYSIQLARVRFQEFKDRSRKTEFI